MYYKAMTTDNIGSQWAVGMRIGSVNADGSLNTHSMPYYTNDDEVLNVPPNNASSTIRQGETGRYFWFVEHEINTLQPGFGDYALDVTRNAVQGGVCACSTNDFKSWKNEGTMVRG